MQLPQHYTRKRKHHFPYTIMPAPHERIQLHKSEKINLKEKWFQPQIPS